MDVKSILGMLVFFMNYFPLRRYFRVMNALTRPATSVAPRVFR